MPAVTIAIRDLTGNVTPATNAADVLAAIKMGEDIVVNGQTAIISNIGGPSGTWLVNAKPIGSFFMPATGPTVHDPSGPPPPPPPPGPPPQATGPPNGVYQYYESDGRLMVWDAPQGRYIAQGAGDSFGILGFAVVAVIAYFLFIRK